MVGHSSSANSLPYGPAILNACNSISNTAYQVFGHPGFQEKNFENWSSDMPPGQPPVAPNMSTDTGMMDAKIEVGTWIQDCDIPQRDFYGRLIQLPVRPRRLKGAQAFITITPTILGPHFNACDTTRQLAPLENINFHDGTPGVEDLLAQLLARYDVKEARVCRQYNVEYLVHRMRTMIHQWYKDAGYLGYMPHYDAAVHEHEYEEMRPSDFGKQLYGVAKTWAQKVGHGPPAREATTAKTPLWDRIAKRRKQSTPPATG
jgi:hypothetical protein